MTALRKRLFAWMIYGSQERINAVLKKDKQFIFSKLKGTILEIGAGTGINLQYYPKNCKIICLEPNFAMHKYLRAKAKEQKLRVRVITGHAESIPVESSSVEVVVSTHVLCSVDNVAKTLGEIKRVLKKGGKFVFIEHVAAEKYTFLRVIQGILSPIWSLFFDRCQINRKIGDTITQAGFSKVSIIKKKFAFPVVSPHIVGTARK